MGFLLLIKHLETTHWQLWSEWINQEKKGPEGYTQPTKKGLLPPHQPFLVFFGSATLYTNDDPNQSNLKRI